LPKIQTLSSGHNPYRKWKGREGMGWKEKGKEERGGEGREGKWSGTAHICVAPGLYILLFCVP